MGGSTIEGWLTKRGSGYPHKWQRRFFVFLASNLTLYYFSADGSDGGSYAAKGEVVIQLVRPTDGEALGLTFEVSSANRSGGLELNRDSIAATQARHMLARAPNASEHTRWLKVCRCLCWAVAVWALRVGDAVGACAVLLL